MRYADYNEHFPALMPPEDVRPTAEYQLAHCPVAHAEDRDFWVVNPHSDVLRLLQDWRTFESGNHGVRVPHDPPGLNRPPFPPIDSNPPVHREFRDFLNPFLTAKAVAGYEGELRAIIAEVIEDALIDGKCNVATDFAKVFPARTTFEVLFGIERSDELEQVRDWVRRFAYKYREAPEDAVQVQRQWDAWMAGFVSLRRSQAPRGDIIDALLEARIEGGRPLTDPELVGAVQILTLGGFSTTADATCNIVIALIERPGLEQQLREHPEKIADAIEEILRLDPPVTARPRRCTHDVEFAGQQIREGDRLLANYVAANIDPDEFENPHEFDIDRRHNRHLTFGAGPHRCIGSNFARTSLRLMVEELLARATDFAYASPDKETRISFGPSNWRTVDSLEITYRRPR